MKKKKDEKYAEGYFIHWLAMYNLHQDGWTKKSVEQQIDLYKSIEGAEAYQGLKEEVRQIILNRDLAMFREKVKNEIRISDLEFMANVIISVK